MCTTFVPDHRCNSSKISKAASELQEPDRKESEETDTFPAIPDLRTSDTQPSNEPVVTLARSHSFRFSGSILLRRWQLLRLALS